MVRARGGKIWRVAKRLEDAAHDPTVRAVAASAAVAAGGLITATAVKQRIANRRHDANGDERCRAENVSDVPPALAPEFERIYRRGRRALRVAEKDPTAENLRELRKRTKDLWQAARVLQTARPKAARRLARRAHRLSDLLGDDHDLAVLLERASSQPELFEDGELKLLTGLVKRRRRTLARKALRRAERLYRGKPRKLARKLSLA